MLFLADLKERTERGVLFRDGVGNLFSRCWDIEGELTLYCGGLVSLFCNARTYEEFRNAKRGRMGVYGISA